MNLRDIILQRARTTGRLFEPLSSPVTALTVGVDYANSPAVATRPGYIWIKEYALPGGYAQVFNGGVPLLVNLPVIVDNDPKKPYIRQATNVDWDALINVTWGDTVSNVGIHHTSHEWPDWYPNVDVVNIYPRAMVQLRTQALTGYNVYITYCRYQYNGKIIHFDGATFDWSAYINTSQFKTTFILIYLDVTTNEIAAVNNSVLTSAISGTDYAPHYPDIPDNAIVSAIILHTTQVTTTESMIIDVRSYHNTEASIYAVIDGIDSRITSLETIPKFSLAFDTDTEPTSLELVTGVWTQLPWDMTYASVYQDTATGLNDSSYVVSRGGDYHLHAEMQVEYLGSPASENVKFYIALGINGSETYQQKWVIGNTDDGHDMVLTAYVVGAEVDDTLELWCKVESVGDMEIHYILRMFGYEVGVQV